ncbi:MAG: hypothetical protein COA99_13650 [Moraxellaceae bacterium]|nr:MAG: hypothetical protein COA99_13650 [Moraxellaceae bacterium]
MKDYYEHLGRAKENVEGPFYTVDIGSDCGCLLPEETAPTLVKTTEDRRGQTYFIKQPETEEELIDAIEAVNICDIHDVRYGGKDPKIIRAIEEGKSDFIIKKGGDVVLPEGYA